MIYFYMHRREYEAPAGAASPKSGGMPTAGVGGKGIIAEGEGSSGGESD